MTGLCLSSSVPGFLVTSSFDELVKVWDIENGNVTFIAERQFPTVGCLARFKYLLNFKLYREESMPVWSILIFRLHLLLVDKLKDYKYGIVAKTPTVSTPEKRVSLISHPRYPLYSSFSIWFTSEVRNDRGTRRKTAAGNNNSSSRSVVISKECTHCDISGVESEPKENVQKKLNE